MSQRDASFDPLRQLRLLLTGWYLVVAATVVGALAGGAVAAVTAPVYQASTAYGLTTAPTVLETLGGQFGGSGSRAASTAALTLQTTATADAIEAELGFDPEAVVSVTGDADLIRIQVVAPSPDEAVDAADAYLERLDALIVERRQGTVEDAVAAVQAELEELRPAPTPPGEPAPTPDPQIESLASLLTQLQAVNAVDLAGVRFSATPPEQPIAPVPERSIALGAVIGLLLGSVAAVVIGERRGTVIDAAALRDATGLPVVTEVPRATKHLRTLRRPAVDLTSGAAAEAYRGLAAELARAGRTTVVAAARPLRARDVADSIAVSAARNGRRVALVRDEVDADAEEALRQGLDEDDRARLAVVPRDRLGSCTGSAEHIVLAVDDADELFDVTSDVVPDVVLVAVRRHTGLRSPKARILGAARQAGTGRVALAHLDAGRRTEFAPDPIEPAASPSGDAR